jgi:hypothetical protein
MRTCRKSMEYYGYTADDVRREQKEELKKQEEQKK